MNSEIKDILNRKCTTEEKYAASDLLADELSMARGILSGKYEKCPKCNDYYLTRSYICETEIQEAKICVYRDIINSGGNEYEDGYVDITYRICPKNHRFEVDRKERGKR